VIPHTVLKPTFDRTEYATLIQGVTPPLPCLVGCLPDASSATKSALVALISRTVRARERGYVR
jgi:hypothetical protein